MVATVPVGRAHPFEDVARAHHDALVGFATRLCGDRAEGRDLVQDAFERALRSYHRFEPGTDPMAWLTTIVHNAFIDRCRKRARAPRTEPVDDVQAQAPASADTEPAPIWSNVSAEQLRAAIDELEPEFRDVYLRHSLDGRSYQEIAAELGLPVNTVGTRLSRARRKLRAILTRALEDAKEAP